MKALQPFVESSGFRKFVIAVIVINAIALGLETSPSKATLSLVFHFARYDHQSSEPALRTRSAVSARRGKG